MISDIKGVIEHKLKDLYPLATIYDEVKPVNFAKPSFLIQVIDQKYTKILMDKYKNVISLKINYFSDKDENLIKNDILIVQEKLFREIELLEGLNFKIRLLNKRIEIVSNELNFMFDVKYSEEKVIDYAKINKIEQINSNLKED